MSRNHQTWLIDDFKKSFPVNQIFLQSRTQYILCCKLNKKMKKLPFLSYSFLIKKKTFYNNIYSVDKYIDIAFETKNILLIQIYFLKILIRICFISDYFFELFFKVSLGNRISVDCIIFDNFIESTDYIRLFLFTSRNH